MAKDTTLFFKDIDRQLSSNPQPDNFWKYVPAAFVEALLLDVHKHALNALLAGIRDRNLPATALYTSGQFIVLHSSPFSNWSLILHKVPPRFLYLSPMNALQAAVAGSDLYVEKFTCPRPNSFELLDPSIEISSHPRELAEKGKIFSRHGREEILEWSCAADAVRPGMTLRVNSGPLAHFEWAFDRTTKRPVGLTPVDPIESNLTTVFALLGAAGSLDSIQYIEPFLRGERHFIRWKAAQAIAAIDAEQGRKSLELLTQDPHPEVQSAAHNSLGLAA